MQKQGDDYLDIRVLLLQELPVLAQGRGDIDEEGALEGGAGLVVDGVVAGLGGVQRHAQRVVDVEHRDVAGGPGGLDVHCVVVCAAVHCSMPSIASVSLRANGARPCIVQLTGTTGGFPRHVSG